LPASERQTKKQALSHYPIDQFTSEPRIKSEVFFTEKHEKFLRFVTELTDACYSLHIKFQKNSIRSGVPID
jgi:hypothetical protein